jgi:hypothetical protein
MADTFNALRANDLIWSFFVSNYLMGKTPPAFDLLFWNSDQTRMPKALHMAYLRRLYGENALARGEFEIGGVQVDLSKVKTPLYFQASREDHIAPMNSVYRSARLFGGDVTYTLAGSGHIAGVVNHPDAAKYQHWINEALPDTLAEWQQGAKEHPGSWWPRPAQRPAPAHRARTGFLCESEVLKRLDANVLLAVTTLSSFILLIMTATVFAPSEPWWRYGLMGLITVLAYSLMSPMLERLMKREAQPLVSPEAPSSLAWSAIYPGVILLAALAPIVWTGIDYGLVLIVAGVWFGTTLRSAMVSVKRQQEAG